MFALAITGMHFTGMSAVRFIPDPARAPNGAVLQPFNLAVMVAASAAFIVAQGLIVAMIDRYLANRAGGEALRMRKHIAELESTQAALEKASLDLSRRADGGGRSQSQQVGLPGLDEP